ncbi:hypothetical protein AVEN_200125-1 [Araneus ventricosus]|uniref:Secreted protein n=1 Tax=Araneus ventricosus TaxID=182803 RepID=A0A4Y2RZI6_ARAVE|nr:hypothetical protein AVEN_200125-1 [Araneus ventricosus]
MLLSFSLVLSFVLNNPAAEDALSASTDVGGIVLKVSRSSRPRWPSGKVSASGPESSRFETRFHRRSTVYGASQTAILVCSNLALQACNKFDTARVQA